MPKLDIKKVKKYGMAIFHTKEEMLKYIKKVGFKDSVMRIRYFHKKWFVRWE